MITIYSPTLPAEAASIIIAHYSVNFDLIQTSLEVLALQSLDSVYKAIASVVVLVGVAKNSKQFLAIFV